MRKPPTEFLLAPMQSRRPGGRESAAWRASPLFLGKSSDRVGIVNSSLKSKGQPLEIKQNKKVPSWDLQFLTIYLERAAGIEPASLAWKAKVLPLHNARAAAF